MFTLTVGKSQGQTLKRLGIHLLPLTDFFPHGQLCVAFTQSPSFDNVALANIGGHRQRTNKTGDVCET